MLFLNQARAWFLDIDLVREVCVSVCVSAPEASNNQWRDMDPIWLVKQVLQLLYGSYSRYH